MEKIRIGVLCPSEIAFRRFLPALQKMPHFEFAGVAVASAAEWAGGGTYSAALAAEQEKAQRFKQTYGGRVFQGYGALLAEPTIDAVYIPLPPALHFKWAKAALEYGRHVFVEKPSTTALADTEALVCLARKNGLALHENYMFQYHSQLAYIKAKLAQNAIGDIRLIRASFGFPLRGNNDFRYNKALGGGALLDCGGYPLLLASLFLGESARITASALNGRPDFEVDIYGSATLTNKDGLIAQVAFGMDNSYKCELEIWGSTGTLYTNRILTAPDGFEPIVTIKNGDGEITERLPADDSFLKSILRFYDCILSSEERTQNYNALLHQSQLIECMKGTVTV